eukprot:scaffold10164_cov97-Cylindrotheca_fusiformis.AAC.2
MSTHGTVRRMWRLGSLGVLLLLFGLVVSSPPIPTLEPSSSSSTGGSNYPFFNFPKPLDDDYDDDDGDYQGDSAPPSEASMDDDDDDESLDDDDDHKKKNHKRRQQGNTEDRPLNDDDDFDCENLSEYLQNVYPQCRDQSSDSKDFERPDDSSFHQSIVPVRLRLGVRRQKLTTGEIRFLRVVINRAMSNILDRYTPFQVPRPQNDNSSDSDSAGTSSTTGGSSDNAARRLETMEKKIDTLLKQEEEDGNENHGHSITTTTTLQGGRRRSARRMEQQQEDNVEDVEDVIDPPPGPRKSDIWLIHWFTGISGHIGVSSKQNVWFYPFEVEYMAFWKDDKDVVRDTNLMKNVTRICWQVGNYTTETGQLRDEILIEMEKQLLLDKEDSDADDSGSSDSGDYEWTVSEKDIFFDPDFANGPVKGYDDVVFPTYPMPLEDDWDKRSHVGALLFGATTFMALLMRYCSTRSPRSPPQDTMMTGGTHFLTEEGVNEILQVGWNFQKPKDGSAADLFMQVYDKSKVGYNDDNSMLMGGVENGAVGTASPAFTNWTATTERSPNTHQGSESSNSRIPLSSMPGDTSDDGGKSSEDGNTCKKENLKNKTSSSKKKDNNNKESSTEEELPKKESPKRKKPSEKIRKC